MDLAFLRNHPLTFGLKSEQLKHLGALLEPVELQPGDQVLGEGVPSRGLFVFRDGKLQVTQKGSKGSGPKVLAELEAPTIVGELELVTGGPAAATVTAAAPTTGALLTADAFGQLVDAGDAAVAKLLRNLARVLAQRLLETNKRAGELVSPAKQAELAAVATKVDHSWNV